MLSDHYDPTARELRLSEGVFDGRSIAALGIACHEAGHAIQHARGYAYLGMRSALVPVINLSSRLYVWVILAGILFHRPQLMLAGVVLLALSVVFALVTLPVEWDASRRARLVLVQEGMVMPGERAAVREVLDAAYLTYVASAVTAVLTLLYYLWSLGLLGRSRDD
jgi:Zn-dependent membrane protease YugP